MPQPVANGEKPLAVVAPEGLVVAVQIRHVGKHRRQPEIRRRAQGVLRGVFQRAQRLRKRQVLFIGQRLIVKHQYRIAIHAIVQGFGLRGCERLAQINAVDLGADKRSQRAYL